MPTGKFLKAKGKSEKQNILRNIQNEETSEQLQVERTASDQLKVDFTLENHNENQQTNKNNSKKKKSSKQIHFAFLPERYEPLLEEDEANDRAKEEKKNKRKARNKKYRKNSGKALRFSWKCLVAGLQSFAMGYSTPLSAASNLTPNPHGTKTQAFGTHR